MVHKAATTKIVTPSDDPDIARSGSLESMYAFQRAFSQLRIQLGAA
jgi:hypothetical protein